MRERNRGTRVGLRKKQASDPEQLLRAAVKAALNVCGRDSLSGSTLLDIQRTSRTL